jgi:hypothetical protein
MLARDSIEFTQVALGSVPEILDPVNMPVFFDKPF